MDQGLFSASFAIDWDFSNLAISAGTGKLWIMKERVLRS
jgi:hypothetical protein